MAWKKTGMYRDDLRERYPTLAMRADHENSLAARVKLFCRECMTQASCPDCPDPGCFLFPSRPGHDRDGATTRPDGCVPSVEEYEAMRQARDPDGLKAEAARQRFHGKTDNIDDDEV